ncbi:LysR substrate-binding domain-containing protein [Microbacterium esteraromaticum]|uniref:LysR substrate-binding domain-containing protein n=1 Tax=Microbacterium esteraromaticum TaxID=57043 RepID=UPI001DD52558|nr:DNA-binding transcriptional LysR family regulator [Microbacterium esteraromaticum]
MKNDRRRASKGGRPRPAKAAKPTQKGGQKPAQKRTPRPSPQPAPLPPVDETPRTFRLGVIPGATPGRWVDAWKERMPHVDIELVPVAVADQRSAVDELDAALVRLPLDDRDELHVIPLYDEVPVVVASADSFLMATDRLTADDLAGLVLITPGDDVLGPLDLPTVAPSFPTIATTADAVATAATGVGILIVPMSLARLHQRKDADYRPLLGGRTSTVALAWPREKTTPDVEAFVGIVRGRTANSSR